MDLKLKNCSHFIFLKNAAKGAADDYTEDENENQKKSLTLIYLGTLIFDLMIYYNFDTLNFFIDAYITTNDKYEKEKCAIQ